MPATIQSKTLRTCAEQLREAISRMNELTQGLSDAQANFKPGPKKWSINECLDHINIGNRLYADKLEQHLQKARDKGLNGAEPYGRGTLLGRFILNNLRQGAKAKKVPAPGAFKPKTSEHKLSDVTAQFRTHATRLAEIAEQSDGLALGRIKFTTPAAPVGRVTASQAFEMMHLHTHRHLAQAGRVKDAEGYPRRD
ncbi:MAG: DinB family protein [Planctomycetes bacterium]|nr:DinB family protein [Planctomycetota bacterium]